jgi:hypothetical protein
MQVFYPMSGIFAAGKAIMDVYHHLGDEGTTAQHMDELMPFDTFREVRTLRHPTLPVASHLHPAKHCQGCLARCALAWRAIIT